jgi:hypothetical protein
VKKVFLAFVLASLGATFMTAPSAQAAGIKGSVLNVSASTRVGIGVLRVWEGQGRFYSKGGGVYDAVISNGQETIDLGWFDTDGFYIGSGYCANTWMREADGQFHQHAGGSRPKLGSNWWRIGDNEWHVEAVRC